MRRLLLLLAVSAAVVVAIPVGRRERSHEDAVQLARIAAVRQEVGAAIDQPSLRAYRADPGFLCLFYARGERYFALEVCYDPIGRLVETVDRRGPIAVYGSVAYRPEIAPVRVSTAEITRILRRHRVPAAVLQVAGY